MNSGKQIHQSIKLFYRHATPVCRHVSLLNMFNYMYYFILYERYSKVKRRKTRYCVHNQPNCSYSLNKNAVKCQTLYHGKCVNLKHPLNSQTEYLSVSGKPVTVL